MGTEQLALLLALTSWATGLNIPLEGTSVMILSITTCKPNWLLNVLKFPSLMVILLALHPA